MTVILCRVYEECLGAREHTLCVKRAHYLVSVSNHKVTHDNLTGNRWVNYILLINHVTNLAKYPHSTPCWFVPISLLTYSNVFMGSTLFSFHRVFDKWCMDYHKLLSCCCNKNTNDDDDDDETFGAFSIYLKERLNGTKAIIWRRPTSHKSKKKTGPT